MVIGVGLKQLFDVVKHLRFVGRLAMGYEIETTRMNPLVLVLRKEKTFIKLRKTR